MENLETARKTLKVLGIISIIFGAIGCLLGLLSVAGGGLLAGGIASSGNLTPSDADTAAGLTGIVMIFGFIVLLSGVFTLLMGIFSLRGSNDFSKVGAAWIFAVINLVFAVLAVIYGLANGQGFSAIWSNLLSIAFAAAIFWAANTIKKAYAAGITSSMPQQPMPQQPMPQQPMPQQPIPQQQPVAQPQPQPAPAPQPEPVVQAQPQPQPEPVVQPEPQPQPEPIVPEQPQTPQ